ncbi:MAG: hypothetical protein HUK19_07215, partial [Fibrobacter sp.]|nr:hypothetical protein [Fibrobacter sp.]
MKAMIKFLISAGFAVVFVACSTESSTQATSTTPVIGKAYAEMVASTRCDNTDKDSHCNEASKALRKVSFQNGGFTNVATVFDDPSGDKMTVRWKDDKEMFIVVPGVSAYTWDQTAVSENASTRKIPYQVTEILSNGTDAKFAPIYIGDDSTEYKYCEKNATSCIALYPAGNFWTEPGNVAPRIGNRLKVQQYKEYTDHMRDSVSKYHHMVSAINAWGDNSLHVYFEQLTSFVEVDLPRTENVKIVGFKGRSVGYSNTTVQEYEIHFKDAIPSGDGTGESIRVVFAIPPVMGSITGDLAFYTKTGEDDNSPIVYKKRLKSELKLSDNSNGGAYWSFDFSTLTGVAEEQNSSSSSDQSSSSQGGSEEPENPEGSSSSQT